MYPLISVIIPVYNVERFMDRCMESILSQTYEPFEVILVDDGSTDGSGEKCDAYATNDDRVTVYHQTNLGLSAARNLGVSKAKGDLITFVDSDDYVTSDYLAYLYSLRERYHVNLSCAGIARVDEKDRLVHNEQSSIVEECLPAEETIRYACYDTRVSVSGNCKLFQKEDVLKHPYPLSRIYEDLATTCQIFAERQFIAISNKPIYYYRFRSGSIMQRSMSPNQMDILTAVEDQLKFVLEHCPSAEQAARVRCVTVVLGMVSRCAVFQCDAAKNYYRKIRSFLRPHIYSALRDRRLNFRVKLSAIAIMMGFYPAKAFWLFKGSVIKRIRSVE